MNQHEDPLKARVRVLLKEHFDAFVILGYSADTHERIVVSDHGKDPACQDGIQVMRAAAARWRNGELGMGSGPDAVSGDGANEVVPR